MSYNMLRAFEVLVNWFCFFWQSQASFCFIVSRLIQDWYQSSYQSLRVHDSERNSQKSQYFFNNGIFNCTSSALMVQCVYLLYIMSWLIGHYIKKEKAKIILNTYRILGGSIVVMDHLRLCNCRILKDATTTNRSCHSVSDLNVS